MLVVYLGGGMNGGEYDENGRTDGNEQEKNDVECDNKCL